MPFIGYTPDNTFHTLSKQTITGDGGTSYTLTNPVIQASNDIETAINNSNNLQEFMALFESVNGASPTIHNWPEGLQ